MQCRETLPVTRTKEVIESVAENTRETNKNTTHSPVNVFSVVVADETNVHPGQGQSSSEGDNREPAAAFL